MEHLLFGWLERVEWLERMDWLTMGLRLMLAIGVIEAMPDQELFAVIHPGPPKIKSGKRFLVEIWQKKWAFLKGFVCQHLNRSSPVLAMMAAIVGAQLPALVETHDDLLRHTAVSAWSVSVPVDSMTTMVSTTVSTVVVADMEPEITEMGRSYQRHWEQWVVGWVCYLLAITQYLIIGLVTSRDRAMDVLSEFDRAVAQRRREIIEEFELDEVVQQEPTAEETSGNTEGDDEAPIGQCE
jgi:hypothetical protein